MPAARLGADRRRMFENARTEKGRLDPLRIERRNLFELKRWNRRDNDRRRRRLMIVTRSNQGDYAFVIAPVRVRMNAFVQLRQDRKRNRPEQGDYYSAADEGPLHASGTFCLTRMFRNKILQNRCRNEQIPAANNCRSSRPKGSRLGGALTSQFAASSRQIK